MAKLSYVVIDESESELELETPYSSDPEALAEMVSGTRTRN